MLLKPQPLDKFPVALLQLFLVNVVVDIYSLLPDIASEFFYESLGHSCLNK